MAGELIINDSTSTAITHRPDFGRGLALPGPAGRGYQGVADPFPGSLIIPRSEWQGRIAERTERKVQLSDLCIADGLPCKNQQSTNYCWVNAPTHCMEILGVLQHQPQVILSPASAGAQIKQFQNVGGWGKEALEWIAEKGVAPVSLWPANAIDRRYLTPESTEAALAFRAVEWWELEPANLDQLVSCLLRGIPVAGGYNWWSHEVTLLDPVWVDGTVAIRIRNSWGMDWPSPGAGGFSVLQGSRMLPDDQVAPRVTMAA